jgi:hypothetical protein
MIHFARAYLFALSALARPQHHREGDQHRRGSTDGMGQGAGHRFSPEISLSDGGLARPKCRQRPDPDRTKPAQSSTAARPPAFVAPG